MAAPERSCSLGTSNAVKAAAVRFGTDVLSPDRRVSITSGNR
jgi:hypothetical protein